MRNKNREQRTAFCFLLPSLLGTTIFVLLPFADVIRRSFFQAVGNTFVGAQNYADVLSNTAFRQALFHTVKFLAICIPLLLVLSFGLALWIYHLVIGRKWMESAFLLPMAIPTASVVVFWRILLHMQGMGNELTFRMLVLCYLWKNTGYDMVLWLAGLSAISGSQYEAAKVDGANSLQIFWYITLPQMKTSAVMITVLSFINAFHVFREAYLISGDYPHQSIYMIQHLFNNWFTKLDIQKMSAAAVMLAFGISILLLLAEWWSEKEEGK